VGRREGGKKGERKREKERVINKTLKMSGTMGRCRKSLRKVNDFKYMTNFSERSCRI